MSASTAIGMVSTSLRNLLIGEMRLNPPVDVTILAPDEQGSGRRINLFLYRVVENPFLKNQDWTLKPGPPDRLAAAPLSLNLFYLLTPYAPNDDLVGNAAAHQILGEAMRVFHENAVVPPTHLDAGLIDTRERLQIATNELEAEDLNGMWTTFSQPFRLSVPYQVSTVQLDRLPESERPMPQRVRRIGVSGFEAPFQPPAVTGMAPAAGPAGTVVTFTGSHLAEHRAEVRFGDRTLPGTQAVTGDAFTVSFPDDLKPGLYEVRVDVSRLFRRTFLFEVTP
ncbi:DUF4255 domain-containing protein [Streptomyces sp. NPDC056512]|uniref:DUF4255 domain-containing protein n=1 Tax=Streptomyces sp. NPDC056512 TaxID=3345846 RepID=UPI0036D06210